MDLRDIILNYLTDNEKGIQQRITWFLNDVMNEEWITGNRYLSVKNEMISLDTEAADFTAI